MFRCYNCGCKDVRWKQDMSPSDIGLCWQGVIQNYACPKCNANILFEIPSEEATSNDDEQIEGQTSVFDLIGDEE